MENIKENIEKFELFLSTQNKENLYCLTLALERYNDIINAADPIHENKKIYLDRKLEKYIYRACVREGWIEQYVPIKIDSGFAMYEVKNGYPIIIRKYGKVEIDI